MGCESTLAAHILSFDCYVRRTVFGNGEGKLGFLAGEAGHAANIGAAVASTEPVHAEQPQDARVSHRREYYAGRLGKQRHRPADHLRPGGYAEGLDDDIDVIHCCRYGCWIKSVGGDLFEVGSRTAFSAARQRPNNVATL